MGNAATAKMLEGMGQGVQIAEDQRDAMEHAGFVASIFEGRPRFNLMFPWREQDYEDAAKEHDLLARLGVFLKTAVDPEILRGKKDITAELIQKMADFGLFALKVPTEYGGLGLSQTAYTHVIGFLSSFCPSIAIMISADNTIGGKFPVLKFGTPEQIQHYLPSLMKWPSAFCFTEKEVGSDPARMRTYAIRARSADGMVVGYKLSGEKWYATNSVWRTSEPLAEYLAVVARIVDSPEDLDNESLSRKARYCYGVFIVPNASEGLTHVAIRQRARFMGMPGIFNGILTFNDAYIDSTALIGGEGNGFKIALQALNTGRISIGGSCVFNSKKCLRHMVWWGKTRQQWGKPIANHELIGSGMLVSAAVNTFAMEAVTNHAAGLVDHKADCRIEAAIAKVISSERGWEIMDNLMQIRGGRGYESSDSLASREEAPPVDQMYVDSRPNRIFEGSTQILSQYVIREGLDSYMKRGAPFFEKGNWWKKSIAGFGFAKQFIALYAPLPTPNDLPIKVDRDLKFVETHARKLARNIIVCCGRYQKKMEYKQLLSDRFFWIASELYTMTAVWSYARHLCWENPEFMDYPMDLAEMYCRMAKRRINNWFAAIQDNDDDFARCLSKNLLEGHYGFVQEGVME